MTLADIVSEIKKPARDPREGMPPVLSAAMVVHEDLSRIWNDRHCSKCS